MTNDPRTVRDVVRYLGVFALVGLVVLGALMFAIILRDADPAAYAAAITPIVTLVASAVTAIGVLLANAGSVDTSKLQDIADLVRTERDKAVAETSAMVAATAAPLQTHWLDGTVEERLSPVIDRDYDEAEMKSPPDDETTIGGVPITDPVYAHVAADDHDDDAPPVVGVA